MKYRIVEAASFGPVFFEYGTLEVMAQSLLGWTNNGLKSYSGSIWKKVRGKWVPLHDWAMK